MRPSKPRAIGGAASKNMMASIFCDRGPGREGRLQGRGRASQTMAGVRWTVEDFYREIAHWLLRFDFGVWTTQAGGGHRHRARATTLLTRCVCYCAVMTRLARLSSLMSCVPGMSIACPCMSRQLFPVAVQSATDVVTASSSVRRPAPLYTYHRPSQHSTTHALTNRSRRGHLALPAKPLEGTHARLERGR